MSVVVVGNAVNLRGKGLGRAIDCHDVVIRVNFYRLRGYVPDVGCKTTHWAVGSSGVARDLIAADPKRRDCRGLTVWTRVTWVTRSYRSDKSSHEDLLNMLHGVKHSSAIDRSYFDFLINERSRVFPEVPTTGLTAIIEALRQFGPVVDIAGFGLSFRVQSGYYWDPDYFCVENTHDLNMERLFINSLQQDGRVRRLDQ